MFLSSLFYPLEGTPDWLRIVSSLNPLTWYTDVMRWLLLGVGSGGWMLFESLLFGVFLLASFGGALKALSRSVE
jgi:ABC-type polysaccharide/polyol phosphate export permease